MNIELCYKNKKGKCYAITKYMTIKEAEKYYKEQLKDDENIIEVWLRYFNGWHHSRHKTLKKFKEGENGKEES